MEDSDENELVAQLKRSMPTGNLGMDNATINEFYSYVSRANWTGAEYSLRGQNTKPKRQAMKWAEIRPIPEAVFDENGVVIPLPIPATSTMLSPARRTESVPNITSLKDVATGIGGGTGLRSSAASVSTSDGLPRDFVLSDTVHHNVNNFISANSPSSSKNATPNNGSSLLSPPAPPSILPISSIGVEALGPKPPMHSSSLSISTAGGYNAPLTVGGGGGGSVGGSQHGHVRAGGGGAETGSLSSANYLDNFDAIRVPLPSPAPFAKDTPVSVALESFPVCPDDASLTHELLNKLVILKLNGGLGTSMGCKGAKSALEVRNGLTFLDLTVRQVEYLNVRYGVDVPLILMNSFNTNEETESLLSRYDGHHITIHTFQQNCFPCINKATHKVMPTRPLDGTNNADWYPPGHGDVYSSLMRTGILEKMVHLGKTWIFISNIDNLGATVDLNLLYYLMCNNHTFCMEVTSKQRQDVTGGTLVVYEGKPRLVELSSVPEKYVERFRSIHNFKMFNTNNLWVDLRSLQELLSKKPNLELEVMVREVRRNDLSDTISLQVETRAGSAVQFFENALAVQVSRERFLPVKTTSDLFLMQSNLFTVRHGRLSLNPQRTLIPPVPTVKLGPNYVNIDEYQRRLQNGVPDILELVHLTVSGDVVFQGAVNLRGTVIIVAEQGSHIDVAKGSTLDDVVVTGNLRVTVI